MTDKITLDVNGTTHTIETDPEIPLLYALRNDIGLNNPHFGCGLAQCGACTVNAIFDATGVRIWRVPFSPDRVKAALS